MFNVYLSHQDRAYVLLFTLYHVLSISLAHRSHVVGKKEGRVGGGRGRKEGQAGRPERGR